MATPKRSSRSPFAILPAMLAGLVIAAGPAAASTPVSGTRIEMVQCCALQTATMPNAGYTSFLVDQTGLSGSWKWTVSVLSPSSAPIKITGWTLQLYSWTTVSANVDTFITANTYGTSTQGLQIYLSAPGAKIRLFKGDLSYAYTNANGIAHVASVPAGQWLIRATASSPVHIEIGGSGVTSAKFDMPAGGMRETEVTVTGAGNHPVVVTATKFEPPILVRRPDTPYARGTVVPNTRVPVPPATPPTTPGA